MAWLGLAFQFLLGCKLCRYVLAGLAIGGAAWAWLGLKEHEAASAARAQCVAEYQTATDVESKRRDAIIEGAHAAAELSESLRLQKERTNAALMARDAQLSRSRDTAACLDADGVQRHREIGRAAGSPAQ